MPVEKHDINTENENENRKPTKNPGSGWYWGGGKGLHCSYGVAVDKSKSLLPIDTNLSFSILQSQVCRAISFSPVLVAK